MSVQRQLALRGVEPRLVCDLYSYLGAVSVRSAFVRVKITGWCSSAAPSLGLGAGSGVLSNFTSWQSWDRAWLCGRLPGTASLLGTLAAARPLCLCPPCVRAHVLLSRARVTCHACRRTSLWAGRRRRVSQTSQRPSSTSWASKRQPTMYEPSLVTVA